MDVEHANLFPPCVDDGICSYIYHIFSEDTTEDTACEFQQDLQLADLLVGKKHGIISAEPLL